MGCTFSPLTPGAKATGHQDKADPAGGSGWGSPLELLQSSTCPKDRAVWGCFWRRLSLGFSNFHPQKGGCVGTGLLSAASGQGHHRVGLVGRVLAVPLGGLRREELSSLKGRASGLDAQLLLGGKPP